LRGTVAEGSVFESKGCLLLQYDVKLGSYYPMFPAPIVFATPKTKGKDCTKELVDQILNEATVNDYLGDPLAPKDLREKKIKKYLKDNYQNLTVLTDKYKVWKN
jgi:response regulator RpfG family c-di-GMP phosphodiesterase